jgi:putative acetyltransferase
VIVRPERADDHSQIAELVLAAFGSPVEPRLVEDLRVSAGYLPELALVADDGDGVLVGHVMFTVTELDDGTAILMLSPLAVRPARQRQGVGSALVHEGLRRAAARDEPLVIVEGDPRYYSRFGFVRASELGLERPHERIPEHAFQALRLPAYDERARGLVHYPPPFDGL